jgi:hypothetical protein
MKIYKTRWFDRWSRKQEIEDLTLCTAVREIAAGLYDADLGGGLIKKRIARPGSGKSGGFRTLLAARRFRGKLPPKSSLTNKGDLWIFLYGFPKSKRSNIGKDEEQQLKKSAEDLLSLAPEGIELLKNEDELIEVDCDDEKTEIGDC